MRAKAKASVTAVSTPKTPRRNLSPGHKLSVFLAGAVILFIEIAGSKLLAVVFGSSLYVWSALITVTLLSIALGAWWGGKVADRWPNPRAVSFMYLGAGLSLGLAVPLRQLVFTLADSLDLRAGTFVSAMMLFFLPLAFLAAISPVVIKLSGPTQERLGTTVGLVSALGTAGSCFGALATGYFLVPAFPLTQLFLSFSFVLALNAAVLWRGKAPVAHFLFLAAWAAFLLLLSRQGPMTALETRQNLYGQAQILQVRNMRLLFLDGILQGGIVAPSGYSISEYTAAMEVLGLSAVPDASRVLVIGLGAGILPSNFRRKGLEMEAVDINPQVVDLCRKWFDPNLPLERLHTGDGRRFLRKSSSVFDLIFVDVFSGEEIPSHLMTLEAFQETKQHLSEKGAVVLNYVGFPDASDSKVLATLQATLGAVFPSVEIFQVSESAKLANFVLVARKSPGTWSPVADVAWGVGTKVSLEGVLAKKVQPTAPYPFLLTDDYCPLDWLDREVRLTWRRENIKMMHLSLRDRGETARRAAAWPGRAADKLRENRGHERGGADDTCCAPYAC